MNRYALKLTTALVAGMMVSGAALAEGHKKNSGPSAKETVEFINGLFACEVVRQLQTPNPNIHRTEFQKSRGGIDKKAYSLTEEIDASSYDLGRSGGFFNFERRHEYNNEVLIVINDLETEVTVKGSDVVLNCNPSAGACINNKEIGRSEPKLSSITGWHMNFCDEDKAQRAAKAMKHLIEISGGKKSLF